MLKAWEIRIARIRRIARNGRLSRLARIVDGDTIEMRDRGCWKVASSLYSNTLDAWRGRRISYERYGEILFQKFAPGHLLHFAQDGS